MKNIILGMVMPIELKREVSITINGRELGFYVILNQELLYYY